jgi:hypothetical protein
MPCPVQMLAIALPSISAHPNQSVTALRKFRQRIAAFFDARAQRTQYARSLELEISRLRAENRALLNSILGVAGIPPIHLPTFTPPSPADGHSESPTHSSGGDESLSRPTSSNPQTAPQSDSSSRQSASRNDSSPSPSTPPRQLAAPSTLSPIQRRRSWHQINRMLELESAKKQSRVTSGEWLDTHQRVAGHRFSSH